MSLALESFLGRAAGGPLFTTGEEALGFMQETGVYLLAIAGLVLVLLYTFVFLKRAVTYLKMMESKYLDEAFYNFLEYSIKVIWALLVLFICLHLLSLGWDWFNEAVWLHIHKFPAQLMWCVIVAIIVGLSVKALHQILQFWAGNLRQKPAKPINAQIALLIEILLKYILIAIGVVFIVAIALTAIGFYEVIAGGARNWLLSNTADIILVIFIIILGYFFIRVSETFFEDLKRREAAYNPKMLDLAKILARYTVLLIVGIAVLFSLMRMFQLGQTGLIIVAIIIVFIGLIVVVAATSNLRNGFSGVILMATRPFTDGDRVRILDGTVCDVVELGIIFTKVRTTRGELMDVPNNEILNRPIFNFSRSGTLALTVRVEARHGAHGDALRETLLDAAARAEGILKSPQPEVLTVRIEGGCTAVELVAYALDPKQYRKTLSALVTSLSDALRERGIEASVEAREAEH